MITTADLVRLETTMVKQVKLKTVGHKGHIRTGKKLTGVLHEHNGLVRCLQLASVVSSELLESSWTTCMVVLWQTRNLEATSVVILGQTGNSGNFHGCIKAEREFIGLRGCRLGSGTGTNSGVDS